MKIAFEWFDTGQFILENRLYIPICEVEIRRQDQKWVPFVFKVDTGADTILMNDTDRFDLGYSLDGSRELKFNTSSDRPIKANVLPIDVRFPGHIIEEIPIAFSTTPIKTLLLGRLKLFNVLDVCFLYKSRHTVFAS
jgi:hypothetical protein